MSVFVVALSLFIVATSAFATGNKEAPVSSSSNGKVTFNLYNWTLESSMTPLIQAFEKQYPNITVAYHKIADASAQTANLLLSSGEDIDAMPQASVYDMRVRAVNGIYEPLNAFMKKDNIDFEKTFGKGLYALYNVKGDIYAIPYGVNSYALYYNKDLFKKAGVPFPTNDWTWNDLRAAAKKLTSGTGANKIYGFLPDYINHWDFPAIEQLGFNYMYKDNGTKSNWSNPAFLKALQFYYDMEMVDKSAWPISEYAALKIQSNPHAIFLQGKAAMYIQPPYIVKYSSEQSTYGFTGFDFAAVNLPKLVASDPLKNIFYTSDFSIPVSAKHKQAAWDFLKFFSLQQPEIYAKAKAMIPAELPSNMGADLEQRLANIIFNYPHFDVQSGITTFFSEKTLIPQLSTLGTASLNVQINTLVQSEVQNCLLGNETPEQAIAKMTSGSDTLIEKSMNQ